MQFTLADNYSVFIHLRDKSLQLQRRGQCHCVEGTHQQSALLPAFSELATSKYSTCQSDNVAPIYHITSTTHARSGLAPTWMGFNKRCRAGRWSGRMLTVRRGTSRKKDKYHRWTCSCHNVNENKFFRPPRRVGVGDAATWYTWGAAMRVKADVSLCSPL